jgi:murein DD-endopeptidase
MMPIRHAVRRCFWSAIATALASASAAKSIVAQQVGRSPLEIRVVDAPTPLRALGRAHLVYEVHLTNFGTRAVALAQFDVMHDSTVLEGYAGPRLAQRVSVLGQPNNSAATALTIAPGHRAIAYLWVSIAPAATTPKSVRHRVVVRSDSAVTDTVVSAPIAIRAESSTALDAPVRGGPWIAIRGPANTSGHRLSFVALGGDAAVPQRFAVDWAMFGPEGTLFHGDSTVAANWYGFGQTVHAVATGVVVSARDGTPDRAAFSVKPVSVLSADEATGNVVVLKLDDGRFATYAHLKQGSVRVKVGARVNTGEALAALGNTGNSLGPHLHFHLSTSPTLLSGEGLPYVLRQFELIGRVNSMAAVLTGTPWIPNLAQPARTVQRESPLENMIVRFTP